MQKSYLHLQRPKVTENREKVPESGSIARSCRQAKHIKQPLKKSPHLDSPWPGSSFAKTFSRLEEVETSTTTPKWLSRVSSSLPSSSSYSLSSPMRLRLRVMDLKPQTRLVFDFKGHFMRKFQTVNLP